MKCKVCSSEISKNMYFCPKCGTANFDLEIKNTELLKSYSEKLQTMIKNMGNAHCTKIAWDLTVDKYVDKIERLNLILSQPEFAKKSSEGLINRISNFVERCKEPEFHIAFVGTIKAGKSTLINALLGRNLASTSVTPETAVLTKFRHSENDYVKVVFYTQDEWAQLWSTISNNADVFKKEYSDLKGDEEKNKWLGHAEIKTNVNSENIEDEIERWTSSKHVEHYFVKEVEIGLKDFKMPSQVVFVDTPGLDDAVKYRSDVTRNYIDRANAVFACVRSDALTGGELNILYRVFSNSVDNPEKIFIIGTQWDSLNNPEKDWKEQKEEWVKYLSTESCYRSAETARRNIVHVAAYLMNLCRDYIKLDKETKRKILMPIAMKFDYDPIDNNLEEYLETLMEKSNVGEVSRRITHGILPKYKEYLMNDITSNYDALSKELRSFFEENKASNEEVLNTSKKSADEIRAKYEKSKKELDEVKAYREQLEFALNSVKVNTDQRVEELCKALENMTQKA